MINKYKENSLSLIDNEKDDSDIFAFNILQKTMFANYIGFFTIAKYLAYYLKQGIDEP